MRCRDLIETKAWRKYKSRDHRGYIVRTQDSGESDRDLVEVSAKIGTVTTGKQRVWAGYFVQVVGPDERLGWQSTRTSFEAHFAN